MTTKLREIPRIDLNEACYQTLLSSSEILLTERQGPKVCRSDAGDIVKFFFRRKRLVSSNLWSPYALRFARNSVALERLGIPAARATAWGSVPHLRRHYVRYDYIPGTTLRSALGSAVDLGGEALVRSLSATVARLHERGVMFRAGHLGNFLHCPEGTLALIDLENLTCYSHPLSLRQRARNFGHILRYPQDRSLIWERHRELFWRNYCDAARLGSTRQARLRRRMQRIIPPSPSLSASG